MQHEPIYLNLGFASRNRRERTRRRMIALTMACGSVIWLAVALLVRGLR